MSSAARRPARSQLPAGAGSAARVTGYQRRKQVTCHGRSWMGLLRHHRVTPGSATRGAFGCTNVSRWRRAAARPRCTGLARQVASTEPSRAIDLVVWKPLGCRALIRISGPADPAVRHRRNRRRPGLRRGPVRTAQNTAPRAIRRTVSPSSQRRWRLTDLRPDHRLPLQTTALTHLPV